MEPLSQLKLDATYAVRTFVKNPLFTVVALVTLALGIGANTAIFTLVNTVLLHNLPYGEPDRLTLIAATATDRPSEVTAFSYPRYQFIESNSRSFASIAAFVADNFNMTGVGEAEQVSAGRVTWNFFETLGLSPAKGRSFHAGEDRPGGRDVVIISHELWSSRFGSDPAIVGRNITLDARSYTIIGVLPAQFQFSSVAPKVDVWVPRVFELNLITPQQVQAGAGFLNAVARLKPGVTTAQAQSEMDVLTAQYRRDNPGKPDSAPNLRISAEDLQEAMVANVRPALLILLGSVGFILLIACSNVANMLLSRAIGRRKEIAIRSALGAGRGAIIRQLITESLLMSFFGAVLGTLLSWWGVAAFANTIKATVPSTPPLHMDATVLAFTLSVSLISGVLFGLVPALQLSRTDLQSALREEGRTSTGTRERARARKAIVIAEVALSMVLLVSSGLLIRSFFRLLNASPGIDASNVLTFQLSLPPARYASAEKVNNFYDRARSELRTIPGVTAASISSTLPTVSSRYSPALPEGQPEVPLSQRPLFAIQAISPEYLSVFRVPLLRGRMFNDYDRQKTTGVAIINEQTAQRFWPNQNPIGKHISIGRRVQPTEIVGVVGDVKNVNLTSETFPEILLPFPQLPWALLNASIRTTVDPHSIVAAAKKKVAQIDPDQPLTGIQTMDEVLAAARVQPKTTMVLVGTFAATAFALALIGIYGVISYSVAERRGEIGVRLALGATPRDILRLVIGEGLRLTAAGIAIGVIASLGVTRLIVTQLYQTKPTDPLTFGLGIVLFICVSTAAAYLPARSATTVHPSESLR